MCSVVRGLFVIDLVLVNIYVVFVDKFNVSVLNWLCNECSWCIVIDGLVKLVKVDFGVIE